MVSSTERGRKVINQGSGILGVMNSKSVLSEES
nr:MAG TPA: hypothetical protein [Caudoviricetes sp.]